MDLSLVPDTIRSSSQWRKRIRENAVLYENYLPSPLSLEAELDCCKSKQSMWEGDITTTPHRVHLTIAHQNSSQIFDST